MFVCACFGNFPKDADPDLILKAIMGTKSPATIAKHANALLHFYRWHSLSLEEVESFFEKETDIYF